MLSLNGRGQSLEDKLYAVRYFLSGHNLLFVVLKATTSELLGPKKKHLDYLIKLTNEPNVSIPHLSKYLLERALHPEWTVSFKSLIVIENLMIYGNERFTSSLASSHHDPIFDKICKKNYTSSSLGYEMSKFVRRYARYINVRIKTYRLLGTDFCRTDTVQPPDESPSKIKTYSHSQLMNALPILQNQFDSLLAFDASAEDLNNGIINSAFSNLYKDFVKLYIAYQAAVIRLLEIFFALTDKRKAQELFEHYKKFLVRMDKVSDFMRVIDSIGMDKSDLPNVSRVPNFSLTLLEQRLHRLDAPNYERPKNLVPASATTPPALIGLPRIGDYISLSGKAKTARPASIQDAAQFKAPQTRRRAPRANLQLGSKTIDESADELQKQQNQTGGSGDKKEVSKPMDLPDTYIGDLLLPEPVLYPPLETANAKESSSQRLATAATSDEPSSSRPTGWVRIEL